MDPWTKKYHPKTTKEIIGQEESVIKLKQSLNLKKPFLISGPTGSGKTSVATALAKELNLELFEVNTSDVRNKEGIETILGSSMQQQSLFARGKLILVDDIDALSGTKDRGGLSAIEELITKPKHLTILTCIDPWEDKFSKLRKKCIHLEFQTIKRDSITNHLKKICDQETIQFTDKDLQDIAKLSKGDLRAAINDLQAFSITKTLNTEDKSERDKEEDLITCLRKILKSKKWSDTINIFDKTNEELNECLLWLDENLPKEYSPEDLKKAYNCLSRADVFNGRIRKWQHWRFLVYINILITSGVALSKKETNTTTPEYTRTSRILKLWMANVRNAKKKSISEKIAEVTHTSKHRAIKDTFPYLKNILIDPKVMAELELNEEEIEWLNK
jgi:replication factor C large subunit